MAPNPIEKDLKSIWQCQSVVAVQMTPDQLRARTSQFQIRIRWRNSREYVAAALIILAFGFCFLHFQGILTRVGSVLNILYALFMTYSLRNYGSSRPVETDPGSQSCLTFHRRELERQRNLAQSWPWGIVPAIPGFVLTIVGLKLEAGHSNHWEGVLAIIGVFSALCIAVAVFNKMTADRLQREIDALESLNGNL
jgi:hypothetical protein